MRIVEYNATNDKLAPNDTGTSAFERAGYRLGRAYREASQDVQEEGTLRAQGIRGEAWPLEFDRFRPADTGIRINFRNSGSGGSRGGGYYYPHQSAETSDGAPYLSRVARQAVTRPLKPMKNPMAAQEQQISDAANDWYYGQKDSAGNLISSVQTGGVNDTTDSNGNPLSEVGGAPYVDTSGDTQNGASAGSYPNPENFAMSPLYTAAAVGDAIANVGSEATGVWNWLTTAQ